MKQLISLTWWKERPGIWASHAALIVVGGLSYLFFRFPLNFTRVHGRERLPKLARNILIVSNHRTMYDSFLIGASLYFPSLITRPGRPPINFPDQTNFFTTSYIKLLLGLLRTVPVPDRHNTALMRRYADLLQRRNILVFYQGTRSYDLEHIKSGPAYAIATAEVTPIVVPVYHEGAERIFSRGGPKTQGIWRWLPRSFFRQPNLIVGLPIPMDDLRQIADLREKVEKMNARIVEAILDLRDELLLKQKQRQNAPIQS